MANGRCRLHGGHSPAGIAHVNWKGAGRSKYLPESYADLAAEVEEDGKISDLRGNYELLEVRVRQLLAALPDDPADVSSEQWQEIRATLRDQEQSVLAEAKRLHLIGAMIPADKVRNALIEVAVKIRENVTDRQEQLAVLRFIQSMLGPRHRVTDAAKELPPGDTAPNEGPGPL